MTTRVAIALLALVAIALTATAAPPGTIRVGSKNFTEQEILGELVAQLLERRTDLRVERKLGLIGTNVCHDALVGGELDVYVEYTGTGLVNILGGEPRGSGADVAFTVAREYRERFGLDWLPPIGFENTYAIAVRRDVADRLGWRTASDIVPIADTLRIGMAQEFAERQDGLPGFLETYGIDRFADTIDLDPGLMYDAVGGEAAQVDLIFGFSTDGRIQTYDLSVLEDDRNFFPPYDAAPVLRGDTLRQYPQIADALALLAGTIDAAEMGRMNYAVDVERRRPADVAREWIDARLGQSGATEIVERADPGLIEMFVSRRAEITSELVQHIWLTTVGVGIALVIGIPVGIAIQRTPALRAPALAVTEVLQTIPSLAMLAFLFVIYQLLGDVPAITALVLYALLPIVLNTFTGINEVPPQLVEAARGLGMSSWQRLRMVEIPLALPMIIAGVRTATVLTIGIATLATFIGAGGLGVFIARGLARGDARLPLLGALPAAVLAVLAGLVIRGLELWATRGRGAAR